MYLRLRIGTLARERNISEHDLWKSTGLARNTVRSLMRGVNTRVDLIVLERIATALGVRPLELFEEVEGQPGQRKPTRKAA
jgi:DNA-binding Xre family transcriptional regulator